MTQSQSRKVIWLGAAVTASALLVLLGIFFARRADSDRTSFGATKVDPDTDARRRAYARFVQLKSEAPPGPSEGSEKPSAEALVASYRRLLLKYALSGSFHLRDPFGRLEQLHSLMDDPEFKKLVAELRVLLKGQNASEILLQAYGGFDSEAYKAITIALMGELSATDRKQQLVEILTQSVSPRLVYASLYALARWGRDEDLTTLQTYYAGTPPNPPTSIGTAIEYAIALFGKRAVPTLLDAALRKDFPKTAGTNDLRAWSHQYLGLIRDPNAAPELLKLAQENPNRAIGAMAIHALARSGSQDGLKFFLQELPKADPLLQSTIIGAMADEASSNRFPKESTRAFLEAAFALKLSNGALGDCLDAARVSNLKGYGDYARKILDPDGPLSSAPPQEREGLAASSVGYLLTEGSVRDVEQAISFVEKSGGDLLGGLIGAEGKLRSKELLDYAKALVASDSTGRNERIAALWTLEKFKDDAPHVIGFLREQESSTSDPYYRTEILKTAATFGRQGWDFLKEELGKPGERYLKLAAVPFLVSPEGYNLSDAEVAFAQGTVREVLVDVVHSAQPVNFSDLVFPDYRRFVLNLQAAGRSLVAGFAAFGTPEDIPNLLTIPQRLVLPEMPGATNETKQRLIAEFSEYTRRAADLIRMKYSNN